MRSKNKGNTGTDYPLSWFKVLDLSDEKGYLCGKILAHLGADVIKIEPLGGDPGRKLGPFYQDKPDIQKSLYWFAYNTNKRSITLNIEVPEGQTIFRKLIRKADVVIESFVPGYLDNLRLGYSHLSREKPGIIMTSITPFGQDGDWKYFKTSDLVSAALGGMIYITGDPAREPLRIGAPQSYLHAAAEAAVGTLIALYHREATGEGQYIDCSVFASWVSSTANIVPFWELNHKLICREGIYRSSNAPQAKIRQMWRCKDGYVCFALMGGAWGAKTNRALCNWMEEVGEGDDFLKQFDWESLDFGTVTQELQSKLEAPFERFFANRTKRELFKKAVELDMQVGPISTLEDLLGNRNLKTRGYWQEVEHPELGATITYPGAFVQFEKMQTRPIVRAPLIGEHNKEIYEGELGISEEELRSLSEKGII